MRVVYPVATIAATRETPAIPRPHPRSDASVRAYAPTAERYDVSTSLTAYSELLCRAWASGESFLNIEHDVEIGPDTVRQATYCNKPWCVWPYYVTGHNLLTWSLGCVRFHAKLLRAEPDLMAVASSKIGNRSMPPGDWHRMDAEIMPLLRERGYGDIGHQHDPVIHHHHYFLEGCSCGDAECPT